MYVGCLRASLGLQHSLNLARLTALETDVDIARVGNLGALPADPNNIIAREEVADCARAPVANEVASRHLVEGRVVDGHLNALDAVGTADASVIKAPAYFQFCGACAERHRRNPLHALRPNRHGPRGALKGGRAAGVVAAQGELVA